MEIDTSSSLTMEASTQILKESLNFQKEMTNELISGTIEASNEMRNSDSSDGRGITINIFT